MIKETKVRSRAMNGQDKDAKVWIGKGGFSSHHDESVPLCFVNWLERVEFALWCSAPWNFSSSVWLVHGDLVSYFRAHRIGQTREVLILRLVTADTVEERILTAAGIKLDKDALVIKSGMFYDSHHDLEDERRNKWDGLLAGLDGSFQEHSLKVLVIVSAFS